MLNGLISVAEFLISIVFGLYAFILLFRFFLQKVKADFYNPICQLVMRATNIFVMPLRKLIPGVFALHQNYPNPFNPTTEIQFDIPSATQINVSIFNLMGQKVKTLANKQAAPGYHIVQWDGTNEKGVSVSTGMYFYTLNTGNHSAMKKMLFLK